MEKEERMIRKAGKQRLEDVVLFHSSGKGNVFYQESLVPFFLMRMKVDASHPDKTEMCLYTPEAEIPILSVSELKGRTKNSQHQHNCFEFTYVLEGNMYQLVEGKRYFYPTDSCCLMNRNTLHKEELVSDYTCVFLSVGVDFVRRLMNDAKPLLFSEEQALYRGLVFDFFRHNMENSDKDRKDFLDFVPKITQNEQVKLVHGIFADILQTLRAPDYGASFRLLELVTRLIGILGDPDCYSIEHVTAQSNVESLLFSRIDRVLSERHGRISHAELAELLSYNGSYLGRIVKKYTGRSLFDYSMTFTMNHACSQLANTEKPVTEIASELRFSNLSHFYQLFRETQGMTPKEYRRLHVNRDVSTSPEP